MDLLQQIKEHLGIITDDETVNASINLKIDAVKGYLESGGANFEKEINAQAINCIAIGVNDLLNNKAGETKFSPAFNILAMQICRG